MYLIVKINYTTPTMNTCSKKHTIHQNAKINPKLVIDETDDILHFFMLPNSLDKPNIVWLLQCDTTTYQLEGFGNEVVEEWKGIRKTNVRIGKGDS